MHFIHIFIVDHSCASSFETANFSLTTPAVPPSLFAVYIHVAMIAPECCALEPLLCFQYLISKDITTRMMIIPSGTPMPMPIFADESSPEDGGTVGDVEVD